MFSELRRRYWGGIGLALVMAWFSYVQGISALTIVVCASVVHEAGHIAAVWLLGGKVGSFSLAAEGAQICTESYRFSYRQEIIAVLAGPLANFLAGIVLGNLSEKYHWSAAAAGANWVLGIFNLMPAVPLDGWRVVQLFLTWWLGPWTGGRIASVCGGILAILLSGGLFMLVVYSGGNLWLLPAAVFSAVSGIKAMRNG